MVENARAKLARKGADLIVAIGARFDDRVTGRLDAFAPEAKKIHIDIDRSSINKNVSVDLPIVGDAGRAMEDMAKIWKAKQHKKRDLGDWWRLVFLERCFAGSWRRAASHRPTKANKRRRSAAALWSRRPRWLRMR